MRTFETVPSDRVRCHIDCASRAACTLPVVARAQVDGVGADFQFFDEKIALDLRSGRQDRVDRARVGVVAAGGEAHQPLALEAGHRLPAFVGIRRRIARQHGHRERAYGGRASAAWSCVNVSY
jgi:hypothetical protein